MFDDFVSDSNSSDKKKFDFAAFKRLVLSELSYKNCLDENKNTCLGFCRKQIIEMAEHPERHGKQILKLSDYMYLKSGYYKRLIDYFVNQAIVSYTVDTRILNPVMLKAKPDDIKKNYIKYIAQSEKFNLGNEIHNILKRMYKNDVCYAFIIETPTEVSYYYLDPMICNISSLVNGNVYEFYINTRQLNKTKFKNLPNELQILINTTADEYGRVFIPFEKSLCIKYNNDFLFPYPPFFMMIADILLIDEYKDLAKAQSINDAYKILTMKIPTKDGEITLDDGLISTFVSVVLNTVQNNIGVITTPFDTDTEEFSSSNSDDRDTVSDAISWAFKNVGVSEALMSGASSGSELKLSITNDSADIFRIYRMLEYWLSLQMKLRNYIYNNYEFVYKIMDMTVFNADDLRKTELQMAQNGLPNKSRLCAVNGLSPSVMIGNSIVENQVLGDIFDSWQPLKTSYVMSGDSSDEGGRPTEEGTEISEVTETQRDNDSNSTENRI